MKLGGGRPPAAGFVAIVGVLLLIAVLVFGWPWAGWIIAALLILAVVLVGRGR